MSDHAEYFPWDDDEVIWAPVKKTLGDTFAAYRKLQVANGPSGLFPGTLLRVIKSRSVPRNAKAVVLPWRNELSKQKRLLAEVSVTNRAGVSRTYKLFQGDRYDVIEYNVHDQHRTYYDHCVSESSPD